MLSGVVSISRRAEVAIALLAAGAAALALSVTLRADFLKHPGWLAVQKADLILGPVLVGLYWVRRRPSSSFGLLLVAYGLLNIGYIAQSSNRPWLFGIGVAWESLIYLGNQVLVVTFPSGSVRGVAASLVVAASVLNAAWYVWIVVMLPTASPGGSISQCLSECPHNGIAFAPDPGRAADLSDPLNYSLIAVAAAMGVLLIWRIATGTPPQRRALLIGTPVALAFIVMQIGHLVLQRVSTNRTELETLFQWGFTISRSAVWYGFLFALIAAQLFAGRALRRLVTQSLSRPSMPELEAMLREPLGDPSFQLRFWDAKAEQWDRALEPPPTSAVTVVERKGRPTVALVHDAQLADDPELVQTAGAVALLAAENAELEGGWHDALDDLKRSGLRTARAVERERHRLASDLHDGVLQRLGAVRIRLGTMAFKTTDEATREDLDALGRQLEEAIEEARGVAHRLAPRVLVDEGLVAALERAIDPLQLEHNEIGRHSPEVDSAVYYCVSEAVQNARRHGGSEVTAALREDDGVLTFIVSDDGPGFDPSVITDGMGLQNLRDRLSALDGRLSIVTAPGRTTVHGSLPIVRP